MCAYRRSRDAGRTRITSIRVIKISSFEVFLSSVFSVTVGLVLHCTLQKLSPRHVNQGGQTNNLLNRRESATPISSVRRLIP